MADFGTRADLARRLGISRAAVSQAFKRHGFQNTVDKKFDLDYWEWKLNQKQHEPRTKAQRSAQKQLPGVNNPAVRRAIISALSPVWDQAIKAALNDLAVDGIDDDILAEMVTQLLGSMNLWHYFYSIIGEQCPPDLADLPFEKPAAIDFDITVIPPEEWVMGLIDHPPEAPLDYDSLPLEELERQVANFDPDLNMHGDEND